MLESLTPTGEVAPYSTTTTQPVDATRSEWSKKIMTPEARAEMRAWLDAQDAQEKAAASPTANAAPTAADVEAQQAREASAQANVARAEREAQPDQFDAPSGPVPTMGGKPLMMPQQPAAPKVDRPYTSTQFDATPEMRGPQTLDQAKDEAAGYKAQVEARLAKQHAEELARIEAERQKKIAEAMQRSEAAAAEYAKAGAALYEEPSVFNRLGTAIALGFGAYGAGLTGGPNHAAQIIQNQQQHDMELKKMRIEVAAKKMAAAGASREQIAEWAKGQESHLLTIQKAQLDALEADVTKRLAAFPQAQTSAAQKFAELKEKNAKERFQAIEAATAQTKSGGSSNEGVKVSTVEGKPQGQQRARSASDIEAYSVYEELDKKAKAVDELLKKPENIPTPEQMDDFTNRTNVIVGRQLKESHGNADVFIGKLGRALDALPESAYPEGMTPEQRQLLRLHTEQVHQFAVKKFGQSAMSNPESYHEFVDPLLYNRGKTREEGGELMRDMAQQVHTTFKNMAELSGAGEKRQALDAKQSHAAAPKAKPEPPTSSKEMARRVAALPSGDQVKAMQAFKVQKNDPRFPDADKWLKNRGLR